MKSQILRRSINRALALGPLGCLFLSGAALEQAHAQGASSRIDEVVVTAQRREQSVQDVPISMSALPENIIEERQITDLLNLRGIVPNLSIQPSFAGGVAPQVFIRGVGTDQANYREDLPVGIYVNDVYIARPYGNWFSLYDVERIEVLRGPQGTLYGRNTSGGALKIQTTRPSLTETSFKGDVAAGNYGLREIRMAGGAPLVPGQAGIRLSAVASGFSGYGTDLRPDRDNDKNATLLARAQILWEPTEDLELTLGGHFSRYRSNVAGYSFAKNPPCVRCYTGNTGPNKGDDLMFDADEESLDLRAVWSATDTMTLSSITGWRKLQRVDNRELDGSEVSGLGAGEIGHHWQVTQELLASFDLGPLNLTAGGYFFKERAFSRDYFDFELLRVVVGVPRPSNWWSSTNENESLAAFLDGAYAISDRLTLTAGMRYTDESRGLDYEGNYAFSRFDCPVFDPSCAVLAIAPTQTKRKFSKTTWRAVLDYSISDDVMVFASTATGFAAGRIETGGTGEAAFTVLTPPESVRSLEFGIKADWFDSRVRSNLTYFNSKLTDRTTFSFDATGGTGFSFDGFDADLKGIELELNAFVTQNLELRGSLGTLSTSATNPVGAGAIVSGSDIRIAPKWVGSLNAIYRHTLPGGTDLAFSVDYQASASSEPGDGLQETPENKNLGFNLLHAALRVDLPGDRWWIEFSGRNLTDALYSTTNVRSPFITGPNGPLNLYAPPRTYMFRIGVSL